MKKRFLRNRGFTFIELLVVVTIIGVLSAISMVIFTNAGKSSRDSKRQADLESIRQALVLYRSDNGCYPTSLDMSSGEPLVSGGYISSPFPTDPKSSSHVYTYTPGNDTTSCKDGTNGVTSFTLEAVLESVEDETNNTYTLTSP